MSTVDDAADRPRRDGDRRHTGRIPARLAGWRTPLVTILVAAGLALAFGAFVVGHLTGGDAASPSGPSGVAAAPGPIAVGFAQDMAVHHQQAVLMSDLAQSRAGPAVRSFADAILIGQSRELGLMRGWLALWGKPQVSPHPMAWMSGRGSPMHAAAGGTQSGPHTHAMPGMASPEEINRLTTSSGKKFDILYLQLMIRHHEGGIAMARAATHANLRAVRRAAEGTYVEQLQDIARMRALLSADGAQPLPPPREPAGGEMTMGAHTAAMGMDMADEAPLTDGESWVLGLAWTASLLIPALALGILLVRRRTLADLGPRALGVALLAGVAITHCIALGEHLRDPSVHYVALLFCLLVLGAGVLSMGLALLRRAGPAWALSGAMAAATLVCYVISRSAGLPDMADDIGNWLMPAGVASLICEGAVVALSLNALVGRAGTRRIGPCPRLAALAPVTTALGFHGARRR